jgi:hypothetical protein
METKKRNIRTPEKWIGKVVINMANWRDYQYTDTYFVCEETKTLHHITDDASWEDYFATKEDALIAGYDECYSYCEKGLYQMWKIAYQAGKITY